ncbi:MAG: hypothetical protein HYZ11_09310 [Candidatus Tectomicrobia bacterium]|uniref:Uncharacterized protein n=1 Tax=Tectimicrobiota bacterium TaxID=2528274 RepID=A0A932I0E0_UNCTE|nr:hypothetical protein [Candidatus Tectomicrobia bacterium]
MRIHRLEGREIGKALAVGVLVSLILSAVMVPAFALGLAPMPKQPSLAFAETLLGRPLPLPVGLLFHVAYLTFWTLAFVVLFRDNLSFWNALALSLFLWVVILVVFFPFMGWGFLGLGVSPKLIPASLVPHVLYAVVLWGLCRWAFAR